MDVHRPRTRRWPGHWPSPATAASEGWKARAVAELAKIKDAEDRQVLEQDIATLP